MRQIILDTETTGLSPQDGHRIIEIGCIELVDRRFTGNNYHVYINPERVIDRGAMNVHGITNEYLKDKPLFSDIADAFIEYSKDAELIIHNAPFDVGFLNAELIRLRHDMKSINQICSVLDTLQMARKKHPGQRNSLDALCKRYEIDHSNRNLHGALIDAKLLAQVYLLMTGGQGSLFGGAGESQSTMLQEKIATIRPDLPLTIIKASPDELKAHTALMETLKEKT